jgi:hypothetical protein
MKRAIGYVESVSPRCRSCDGVALTGRAAQEENRTVLMVRLTYVRGMITQLSDDDAFAIACVLAGTGCVYPSK